MMMVAPNNEGK